MNQIVSDSSIVASNQWNHLSDKMDELSLSMANFDAYVVDSQKSKDGKLRSLVCKFKFFF